MCSLMQVCVTSVLDCGEELTVNLVADLSVMLALMAGRNGAETMLVVNDGKVHIHSLI